MASFDVVQGWTGNLDFQLKVEGTPAILSTDDTVSLILRRADGVLVSTTSEVVIISASDGKVRYTPGATDLLTRHAPYGARFKLVDPLGKVVFFPNGRADLWNVHSQ
jgi:hypothetical protein